MDDATKKFVIGLASGFLRRAAIAISGALTMHGIAVSGSFTETFVSVGIGFGVWAYSTYGDTVKAIIAAQFEVLKAKSLAQAAKLHANNIALPDAHEVAAASAKSPDVATLSVEEVKKVSASLPAAVAGTTAVLALFFVILTLASPALAAQRKTIDLSAQRKGFIGTVIDKTAQDIAAQKAAQPAAQDGLLGSKIFQQLVKPLNDLQKFVGSDLNGGIKLSTLIPDLQDGHGQQCYIAMRSFTAIFKAHPLPATLQVVTDFEAFRLAAAAATRLCHDTHCIQLSVDTTNAIQRTVGPLAAGVTPPTLQSLCAYVPDVPLVPGLAEKDIPPDPGASIGAIIPGTGGQMMSPDGSFPAPVAPSQTLPVTPQ